MCQCQFWCWCSFLILRKSSRSVDNVLIFVMMIHIVICPNFHIDGKASSWFPLWDPSMSNVFCWYLHQNGLRYLIIVMICSIPSTIHSFIFRVCQFYVESLRHCWTNYYWRRCWKTRLKSKRSWYFWVSLHFAV